MCASISGPPGKVRAKAHPPAGLQGWLTGRQLFQQLPLQAFRLCGHRRPPINLCPENEWRPALKRRGKSCNEARGPEGSRLRRPLDCSRDRLIHEASLLQLVHESWTLKRSSAHSSAAPSSPGRARPPGRWKVPLVAERCRPRRSVSESETCNADSKDSSLQQTL